MKRFGVIGVLIVIGFSIFADAKIDKTLKDFSNFIESNKESIASISHGITSDIIYNYVDGEVVRLIHKSDFNGLYNEGLVIKCTPHYFFHNQSFINEYYIFISNLVLNPEIKEGSKIEKFKTIIGKSSMETVPYNGGNDTKYVVYTYEKNNKHLIALSDGHPGITLPGIDDTFIFPGRWLLGDAQIDYLTYEALRKNSDLVPVIRLLEDNDASYSLDIAHTISVRLDKFNIIQKVDSKADLDNALQSYAKMFHGLPFTDMEKYIEYKIDGHSFYIVATDKMMEYYNNEVEKDPPVLYLRTIGAYKQSNLIKPVFYLVDFQPFFYEDKVEAIIKAYSKQ